MDLKADIKTDIKEKLEADPKTDPDGQGNDCRLTIFTPVYNRAYCIGRCYESMLRQKNQNFVWIIVDDGSEDHLEDVVRPWLEPAEDSGRSRFPRFRIEFYQKENGGLNTAYNLALSHVKTDYWVCIDSDDWLADDAVETIYRAIRRSESRRMKISGFAGLDAEPDGTVCGGRFPHVRTASLMDLKFRYKHKGDFKVVYRTAAAAPFLPIPEVKGEKNFNPYYMMLQIDREAPLLILDHVLCIVDYQPDGMSARIFEQYEESPVSFGMLRLQYLQMPGIPWWFRYRQCMHYVSSWLFAVKQRKKGLRAPFFSMGMILALAPGFLLHFYIRLRNRFFGRR